MTEYAGYKVYRGPWRDAPDNAGLKLLTLVASGGRVSQDASVDYDLVDVYLVSKQKGLTESKAIADFAYAIRDRLKVDWAICDIVRFQLVGGISGPGMTEQDRYWYRLTMQVTQ
jgi:hypothetical protein